MTKPPGSLGVLEDVAAQLAGIAGQLPARRCPSPPRVAVFAGDHGVHAQGVTPWPQEVTAQMVANFLAGGAVVNAFAAELGAEVVVVDVGVAAPLDAAPGLLDRKVRPGTADLADGPGDDPSTRPAGRSRSASRWPPTWRRGRRLPGHRRHGHRQHHRVGRAGLRLHRRRPGRRPPAAAPASTTRRWPARSRSSRRAVAPRPGAAVDPEAALAVLAEVGGLEHAALAGFILGAAARRMPVLLDGAIAGSAALVAAALCPTALEYARRRAPLGRARARPGAGAPRAAPAARPGPAARRGHRRAAGAAAGGQRRAGAARRGHVRLGRRDREERLTRRPAARLRGLSVRPCRVGEVLSSRPHSVAGPSGTPPPTT